MILGLDEILRAEGQLRGLTHDTGRGSAPALSKASDVPQEIRHLHAVLDGLHLYPNPSPDVLAQIERLESRLVRLFVLAEDEAPRRSIRACAQMIEALDEGRFRRYAALLPDGAVAGYAREPRDCVLHRYLRRVLGVGSEFMRVEHGTVAITDGDEEAIVRLPQWAAEVARATSTGRYAQRGTTVTGQGLRRVLGWRKCRAMAVTLAWRS